MKLQKIGLILNLDNPYLGAHFLYGLIAYVSPHIPDSLRSVRRVLREISQEEGILEGFVSDLVDIFELDVRETQQGGREGGRKGSCFAEIMRKNKI